MKRTGPVAILVALVAIDLYLVASLAIVAVGVYRDPEKGSAVFWTAFAVLILLVAALARFAVRLARRLAGPNANPS